MSRKSRERKKAERKESPPVKPELSSGALRQRRNRRFLYVGLIALSFPIFEVIAYRFRVITITVVNRSDVLINRIEVSYPGGAFDSLELKPGGSLTRLIRPDFNFSMKGDRFSTYLLSIRFASEGGNLYRQTVPVGGIDYSAQEVYTITPSLTVGGVELQHTTRPGFPLSLVRDLMERLGFG
jgi:hypothetical protein